MPIDPTSFELPRKAELRDRLIPWCDLNSGSDHPQGLDRMRAVLHDAFRALPGKREDIDLGPDAPQGFRVRCRPEAPIQILLNAHFDTVYGADHPFQRCEIVDADRLRGPGVADDKGGIMVLLTALQIFERTAHAKNLGWEVVLGPDEEIGSPTTAALYAAAVQRHDCALVFEPCRDNGDLVRARMGTGTFTATCHGRAAHAGRDPHFGRNAILALAEYLLAAARLPDEMPDVLLNVGLIRGGAAVNIVPEFAIAHLNARVARAGDAARLEARLREFAAPINVREGYRLEIAGGFNRPPMESSPESEALFAAYRECGRMLELDFGWQSVGGGSDGNLLAAAGLPVLDGVGVHGGDLHSGREWVRISSLVERSHLAALFLARLAAGEIVAPKSKRNRAVLRA